MLTTKHLLQAMEAAGAEAGVIYLSTPLTSGLREIALLRELGVTSEELRRDHVERWRGEVLQPNESDAHALAQRLRSASPAYLVVDPSRMQVTGWSQPDYNGFWIYLMERHAKQVVAAPGWEYSKGARGEMGVALALQCPIVTVDGSGMTADDVAALDRDAQRVLAAYGWSDDAVRTYLPEITTVRPPEVMSAATQTFDWLAGEREYQLAKFGTANDDAHTREGLGDDSWWWRQLTSYYHRSRVLGLDVAVGRQALAKFVATGCGLLESAVRLHGPLPAPGVPSGEVKGQDAT